MAKSKMFPTKNDLAPDVREKAVTLLNQQLADTTDLYNQTKQAHWNVKGVHFYQLHGLFDTLAETVEEYIDLIAERATALGGTALGTVRMSAAASRLPEYPLDALDGRTELQYGIAVGWRTVSCGCSAHAQGAGPQNAASAVGTRRRRVDRAANADH